MANDFYDNLFELKEEINDSFPYKSLVELSRNANDFEKMDISRMLIEVCTDITRDALSDVDYLGPILREADKREGLTYMSLNCIHATAGTTLYNDIALVKRLLYQLGHIAYKSYSPKAHRALFDVESGQTDCKE